MLRILLFNMLMFFGVVNVLSQTQLPDSIIVVYYIGGDYRDDNIRGAFDDKDSLTLKYIKESKSYESKTSTHYHEIYPYENDEFQQNINLEPKLIRYSNIEVKEKNILTLLKMKDIENYQQHVVIDTFWSNSDTQKEFLIFSDTIYIPEDFSISYYGIDSNYVQHFCEYYENKLIDEDYFYKSKGRCEGRFRSEELLGWLIELGMEDISVSSYVSYVSILLKYGERTIEYFQSYPGEFETEWTISSSKNDSEIKILNPRINDIISEMLPSYFSRKSKLLEYSDKESIINLYLKL